MIKLRNLSFSDLERVREIDRISFLDRAPYSEKFLREIFQNYPQGLVVAEDKREIVGYIVSRPQKDKIEIVSLAVLPDRQRKGIGTALTKFLIERFQKEEIKEVFLYVRTKNKRAVSFYQELGFKTLETLENFYRNGDNAYLMTKEL